MSRVVVLSLVCFLVAASSAPQAPPVGRATVGQPLGAALEDLRSAGLAIVYSEELVRPEMRVTVAPRAGEPRRRLDELLAPHGLRVMSSAGGTLVVVPAPGSLVGSVRWRRGGEVAAARLSVEGAAGGKRREVVAGEDGGFQLAELSAGAYLLRVTAEGAVAVEQEVEVKRGHATRVEVELARAPAETIDVRSRRQAIVGEPLGVLALERDVLLSLPQVAGDALQRLSLLPGTASQELSARPSIRGGRADEVLVRLDGMELFEPYHLKDYDSALSIVAPQVIDELDVVPGGFSVELGDRMGGVLEMTSVEPPVVRRSELALSILDFEASTAGRSAGEVGWLAALRFGSLALPFALAEQEDDPNYADLFAKIQGRRGDHDLRFDILAADDRLELPAVGDDPAARTRYRTAYAWLNDDLLVGRDTVLSARLAASRIERHREGSLATAPRAFDLLDRRELRGFELAHDGQRRIGAAHTLKWGLDLRHFDARYDYRRIAEAAPQLLPLPGLSGAAFGAPPAGDLAFADRLRGEHYTLYLADRWAGERFTVESGVRFDESSVTDDELLSPRLDAVWQARPHSSLRLSWGIFHQSQRAYELQVEDGQTVLHRGERTEHRALGWELQLGDRGPLRDLRLWTEVYERRITRPRTRYENLFDPLSKVPELEPDRIVLVPTSAHARGLDLLLTARLGRRLAGFLSYTRSVVDDRVGEVDVPRAHDQTDAASLDLDLRLPRAWRLNLAWQVHTGWPTTAVSLADDGTLTLGPLYGERLPDYTRVDLRVSREWSLRRGRLTAHADIQNLFDRRNVRGYEVALREIDGATVLVHEPERWAGILGTFGVRFTF